MAQSIESNIADLGNGWLKSYNLDYKLEQETLNTERDKALTAASPCMEWKQLTS